MDFTQLVSDVLQAFLVIALPPLVVAFLKWVDAVSKKVMADLEAKSPAWARFLSQAVEVAVLAAEQMKLGGLIEDKKSFAIEMAQKYLKELGYEIDISLIELEIEKAVHENFNHKYN